MTNLQFGRVPSSFVGFDRLFNDLERLSTRQEPTYPPHNIISVGEDEFIIELAVAGYRQAELNIELDNSVLTISGEQEGAEDENAKFLHKGISSKKFKRAFTLGEHVEVRGSNLSDGILSIYLERVIPEEKKPRTIEIGYTGDSQQLLTE
jgi:Molecular chaperone (small heat shock protein)